MKVTGCETLHCDAGWRDFSFLKVTTDEGITGVSEFNECYGSPGLSRVIERVVASWVVGENPISTARIGAKLNAATRQAPGGMAQQAIAAVENALLDIKGPGARGPGLRPARRRGARPARALLVALRHLPVRGSSPAYRPAAHRDHRRSRRSRERSPGPRVPRAEDQHLPLRRRRAAPAHAGLHREPGVAGAEREPSRHRGAAAPARGRCAKVPGRTSGFTSISTSTSRPRATSRSPAPSTTWGSPGSRSTSTTPAGLARIRDRVRTPIASCESLFGIRGFRPYFERAAPARASSPQSEQPQLRGRFAGLGDGLLYHLDRAGAIERLAGAVLRGVLRTVGVPTPAVAVPACA